MGVFTASNGRLERLYRKNPGLGLGTFARATANLGLEPLDLQRANSCVVLFPMPARARAAKKREPCTVEAANAVAGAGAKITQQGEGKGTGGAETCKGVEICVPSWLARF